MLLWDGGGWLYLYDVLSRRCRRYGSMVQWLERSETCPMCGREMHFEEIL